MLATSAASFLVQRSPLLSTTRTEFAPRDLIPAKELVCDVYQVVLPRTAEQRDSIRRLALPSLLLPDRAVDAQSLIALSDLVVSAGGTMNREAAALGVPVYTTFAGRLGGVDEQLIRDGRLRQLREPAELELTRHENAAARVRRPPAELLELLLSALPAARG